MNAPKTSFLDWLLTIPFLICFITHFLIFEVLQWFAIPFGDPIMNNLNIIFNRVIIVLMKITGTKFYIEIPDSVKKLKQVIVVANHQSLMDMPFFVDLFANTNMKFISKKELAKWIPFVSNRLRFGGHLLIDRQRGDEALKLIENFAATLSEKNLSIGIFPEGTRARDGVLKSFKSGGLCRILAVVPEIPVVTFTIDGSWIFSKYKLMPVPSGTRIKIKIGEPRHKNENQSCEDFVAGLRTEIHSNLNQMRNTKH